MVVKAFFAGFGGQGVLSMGHLLAQAAMAAGRHVTYLPSYGAEVRGGTANCTVAVGDEEIASPVASRPQIVVAMNRPSALAFSGRVAPGGFLFLDSSLAGDQASHEAAEAFEVPATALAAELGSARSANLVMLGAVVARTRIVEPEALRAAVIGGFARKPKILSVNLACLDKGLEFGLRLGTS